MVLGAVGGGALGGGIGSAIGNIAVLAGAAGEGGQGTREQIVRLIKRLEMPDFDFSEITPAELSIIAEYAPSFYEAVIPDEVKTVQDSPELRDAQMRGLAHLERVEREGLPLAERLAAQEAGRSMARESGRVQEGIVENLRARGRAGGGTELQARMSGAQLASEQARGFGSDLARYSAGNRLQAAHDVGNAAGSIRAQDINVSGQKASAINRFNEYVSTLMTRAAADAAASQERASFANVGEAQAKADWNKVNQQSMAVYNKDEGNRLRQQEFGNELSKLGLLTGAMGNVAAGEDAEQAARAQALRSIGGGAGQAVGGAYDYFSNRGGGASAPAPYQGPVPQYGSAHSVWRASPYGQNYVEDPRMWRYD